MADTLFNTNNKLDEYRNDETIQKMLDGCVLLNHAEFISWFKPPIVTKATRNAHSQKRVLANEEVGHIAYDVLDNLADVVCKGKIGYHYGRRAIQNVSENFDYKKHDLFDILVAVEPKYNKINTFRGTNVVERDKLKSVLGFIVVEKGECKQLKDIYSVHLICSRESKSKTIKGAILLGAYLYCIKSSNEITEKNKRGILELAGGYTNLSGFFAYSKLGFDKDNSLYHELYCFKDAGNLPMSVDLTKYSSRDIIDMVNGSKKRDDVKDDTGIYLIGVPKDKTEQIIQNNIAVLSNMKQMLVLDKEPTGNDYRRIIHEVVDKTDKMDKIQKIEEYIQTQFLFQLIGKNQPLDEYIRTNMMRLKEKKRQMRGKRKRLSSSSSQALRSKSEVSKREASKREVAKSEVSKSEASKREASKSETSKKRPVKTETKKKCSKVTNNSTKKNCGRDGCCVISG